LVIGLWLAVVAIVGLISAKGVLPQMKRSARERISISAPARKSVATSSKIVPKRFGNKP
jgi:hypothetical protein